MPELRAALVLVPPLLADLISATLVTHLARLGVRLVAFDVQKMSNIAADLAILGPGDAARAIAAALFPPDFPMLTLSADLKQFYGPEAADSAAFTPRILAERLRDLADRI